MSKSTLFLMCFCACVPRPAAQGTAEVTEPPPPSLEEAPPLPATCQLITPQTPLVSACAAPSFRFPAPVAPTPVLTFPDNLFAATLSAPPISELRLTAKRAFATLTSVSDGRALAVITGSEVHRVETLTEAKGLDEYATRLLLDETHGRLYVLAYAMVVGTGEIIRPRLLSFALDTEDAPVGPPHVIELTEFAVSMALHPSEPTLFVSGYGRSDIQAYPLDAAFHVGPAPTAYALGNGQHKAQLAVHASGTKLYAGSADGLEVFSLAGSVITALDSTTAWPEPTRTWIEDPSLETHYPVLNFVLTPSAIYRQQDARPSPGATGWPIQRWLASSLSLDAAGNVNGAVETHAFGFSWLGYDESTDELVVADPIARGGSFVGTALDRVSLAGVVTEQALYSRRAIWNFAVSAAGKVAVPLSAIALWPDTDPVANVEMTVTVSADAPGWLSLYMPGDNIDYFAQSFAVETFPSANVFTNVTPLLHSEIPRALTVELAGCEGNLTVEVRLAAEDIIAQQSFTTTTTITTPHCNTVFFIDGNGVARSAAPRVRTYTDELTRYTSYLDPLVTGSQPKTTLISCFSAIGGGADLAAFDQTLSLLRDVGCNSLIPSNSASTFNVEASAMQASLAAHGFFSQGLAAYAPNDGYFDFDPLLTPAALDTWVDETLLPSYESTGGKRLDFVVLADEPLWYYPLETRRAPLDVFRAYLRTKDVPFANIDAIVPRTRQGETLEERQLYYWSHRFFAESASNGMRRAKDAVVRALGHPTLTPVNFNNWQGYGIPSPNEQYAQNPEVSPETAGGSFDWFYSGRHSSHTLFSEDWFTDSAAGDWTYRASMLQSAALLGNEAFGAYVIAGLSGEVRDGMSYRLLSLFGRGAKLVSFFTFGPEAMFPGNCWSENRIVYRELQRGNKRIAFADAHFRDGVASKVRVAVVSPHEATLWDASPQWHLDADGITQAFAHLGQPVRLVDDQFLREGLRDLDVVYVAARNVSGEALRALQVFAEEGGLVLFAPGAAQYDLYDSRRNDDLAPETVVGCGKFVRLSEALGASYIAALTADSSAALRQGFSAKARETLRALTTPFLREASVATSGEQVEVLRLDSAHGIAVSLLNWSAHPEPCLQVRIKGGAQYSDVVFSEGELTSVRQVGEDLEITLSLDRVGVLRLERGKS